MEHVGYAPDVVHGTVHTEAFNHMRGTQRGGELVVEGAQSAFHVYAVEGDAERIDFFADDSLYYSFENTGQGPTEWPFDQRFHLVLNIAVGGMWGGQQGVDDAGFPMRMAVDYVRVYRREE